MGDFSTACNLLVSNKKLFMASLLEKIGFLFNDKKYIELMFRYKMGYDLNLSSPKTFSEKIQWLKLFDRKSEYTIMVDKYAVKEYVSGIIGPEFIIPTIGVWDKPEDIERNVLPEKFVLKTTHGGGNTGVVICREKDSFDWDKAYEKLNESLKYDIYKRLGEWPYKNVRKRIIAERYVEPVPYADDLPDYKWYCFDGKPEFCQVILNRTKRETIDFFDTEWNHQNFIGLNPNAVNAKKIPKRPACLDLQINIAKDLSKDIPFSRIDLYEIGNAVYFGEITFFPSSGFNKFRPDEYNELLGQMIKLPGTHFEDKDAKM